MPLRIPRRLATTIAGIAFSAVIVILAVASTVIVDETQFVFITEMGRVVTVYGDEPGEAGLHLKWPWRQSVLIDRRLHVFDPPTREVITGDKRNLEVGSYVVWRVSDPVRFYQSASSTEAAEGRLNERVVAALSDAIGRSDLAALASVDPRVWRLDTITTDVLQAVGPLAEKELGIEVVDVRLRRFNHPVEVRPAVFELIRSERMQVAATLRAKGEAAYQTITSQADRERDSILAQADAEAERLRGQADAEVARLTNDAHAHDPRFAEFLRTLDAYKAILDDKATVILSTSSPLLKLLSQGPSADLLAEPTTTPAESKP